MGLLSVGDSLPRFLGSVGYIYRNFGTYLVAGLMVSTIVIVLVLTLIFYKRLIPINLTPMVTTTNYGHPMKP